MRRIIGLLLFVFSGFLCHSQIIVGWSGGYGSPHELNRVIHVYNAVNGSGLKKEMQPVHWSQGLAGGIRLGDEFFFELLYSRKRIGVHSEFDSSGVAFERQLKVLSNTWNFGFGFRDEHLALGMSLDFGRFKGFGRRGPAESIGDLEYQRLWVLDKSSVVFLSANRFYVASTLFAEIKFGVIALRGYFQLALVKNQMEMLDAWMLGSALNYAMYQKDKYSSAGLMVSIQFGGK